MIFMRIRKAKLSDINEIFKIGDKDFRREKWFNKKLLKMLIELNPNLCWVLEDKGEIIGARMFLENCGERSVWGWLIEIKKGFRHHHLGTMLFEKVCKDLKKKGYKRILTDVDVKNKESIKWHKSMGYYSLGRVKRWYDDDSDAIIFRKDL